MKLETAFLLSSLLAATSGAFAASGPDVSSPRGPQEGSVTLNQVVDAAIIRENEVVGQLRHLHPLVETYVQTLAADPALGTVPKKDHYFVGKLDIEDGVGTRSLVPAEGVGKTIGKFFASIFSDNFIPGGFARMFFVDDTSFDRQHYIFEFVRREFLGEVRTIVFDVKPRPKSGDEKFLGRVWIEDEGFSIVRFNGTFGPSSFTNRYLHFDSWRVATGPGLWLPAYVYSEESDYKAALKRRLRYKAQTRIWGYDLSRPPTTDELTRMMVEAPAARDLSETPDDLSPVGSLRAWERLAEENVLERMTKGGFLAPDGEVDRVLQTVVENLEVTNNLDIRPEVRCRVLMTTPLESFTIGHTIVMSRGLIDVLPDEASLAMVLSHELAHIALGHRLDTKYAFSDRMFFDDEDAFKQLGFRHDGKEETDADARAIEMLMNSPYKDKLGGAGLFLEALGSRAGTLKALIRPHLGDRLAGQNAVLHMKKIMEGAAPLEPARTDQIAALPLGGRIKVDPWSGRIELLKNKPVALLSAREKMPFEVTPFLPYLTREKGGEGALPSADGSSGGATAVPATPDSQRPPLVYSSAEDQ